MTLTFTFERHQDVIDALNGRAKGARSLAATPMTFGVDVSHWQGPIDFKKVYAAGFRFVVMKATQGVGYTDPNFRTYRAQAHAAGLIVLMYGFVMGGDPIAEADYFIKVAGPLAVGEGTAEDYEPAKPPANPPAWSRTWLDTVRSRLGVSSWIYMNSSTEARYNWSPLAADYGLWLAKYDNNPDMDPVVHWPNLAAEQYWDKATVPGIAGPVDVDVFYGTRDQLLAYCKRPAPAPTPPEDDDMPYDQWPQAAKTALQNDVRNAVWGSPLDEAGNIKDGQPWASTRLGGVDGKTGRIENKIDTLLTKTLDPQALAASLAALLPHDGAVSQVDLEAALRNVLGSLDSKS